MEIWYIIFYHMNPDMKDSLGLLGKNVTTPVENCAGITQKPAA